MGQIRWLGHAGFEIKDSKIIYIDPFKIEAADSKADIILITHSHYDHFDLESIAKISTRETTILITPDSQSGLRNFPGKVVLVEPDKSFAVSGIKIHTTHAYNINKHFHPQQNDWVGYIIESDGKRIYHSGDTDIIPEMKNLTSLNIDIAMLPCGGTYTMNGSEAAQAALIIKPKLAIPMHWGSVVGTIKDAEEFKKILEGKINVQIPVK